MATAGNVLSDGVVRAGVKVHANQIVADGADNVTVKDSMIVNYSLTVAGTLVNAGSEVLTTATGYTQSAANAKFATLTGAEVLTNKTLVDANLTIQDDVGNTKKAKFDAAGISASTTRTYSLPDVSGTLIKPADTGTVSNAMLYQDTLLG